MQARGVLTSQLNRTRWDLAQISGYADQALLAHRWKRTAWKNEKFWESWIMLTNLCMANIFCLHRDKRWIRKKQTNLGILIKFSVIFFRTCWKILSVLSEMCSQKKFHNPLLLTKPSLRRIIISLRWVNGSNASPFQLLAFSPICCCNLLYVYISPISNWSFIYCCGERHWVEPNLKMKSIKRTCWANFPDNYYYLYQDWAP